MSIESVNQFLPTVGQNPTMQQRLQSATDRSSFVNKVVELGHQEGYGFSAGDVETSLNSLAAQIQSQTSADGELSEDKLEAVAGGHVLVQKNIDALNSPSANSPSATLSGRAASGRTTVGQVLRNWKPGVWGALSLFQ